MSWFKRLLGWLFPAPVHVLSMEAASLGDVIIQRTVGEGGIVLWQCSIRPSKNVPARYSWVATAPSIAEALEAALDEAKGNPIQLIEGKFRPKLGGAEFDPE